MSLEQSDSASVENTQENQEILTSREKEILALLSQGFSLKEVARKLLNEKNIKEKDISLDTVRGYMKKIFEKFGAYGNTYACCLAVQNGAIDCTHLLRTESIAITPKEREVFGLVAMGKSNQDISIILDKSSHTIHMQRNYVYKRLGAKNQVHAACILVANHVIRVPIPPKVQS